MVAGRVIGEGIILSVSAIILLVILGLRYISGTSGGSDTGGFAAIATSSLFLTALFLLILGSIVAIELAYRLRARRRRP